MATLSARRAKTSLLSASLKNSLASSSTSKLDENSTGLRSSYDEPIVVTPPSPHRKKSSTTSAVITNNNKESDVGTESRNYQLKKFSQSTPALPQLHYDLVNNLGRSKSRQKKFLRLFPNVARDERVLNRKFLFYFYITLNIHFYFCVKNRLFLCLSWRSPSAGPSVHHLQLLCLSLQCVWLHHKGTYGSAVLRNCLMLSHPKLVLLVADSYG